MSAIPPLPPLDYGAMFALLGHGSPDAFSAIVKKFNGYMIGCCSDFMDGNHHDGEDASQEAWVRLWNDRHRFGPVQYPASLIRNRAKWSVRALRRHQGRQKRWGQSAFHDEQVRRSIYGVEWQVQRGRVVEIETKHESGNEFAKALRMIERLITTLKPADRKLIEDHYFRNIPIADLAAMHRVTGGCMRSRHHDVLTRMRKAAHKLAITH